MPTALQNKDLQKLQAMMMIHMRVQGKSMREIAESMNMHVDTVERRLLFANKAGLYLDFERQLLQEIAPLAMTAIKTALQDGDAETAVEVLRSMNILKDPKAQKTQQAQAEDDELAKAIAEARENQLKLEGIVDGTIISGNSGIGGRSGLAGLLEAGNDDSDSPAEETVDQNWPEPVPTVEFIAEEVA